MRAKEFVTEVLSDKNITALQQAKDAIAKNREDDVAAWAADVAKNFDKWAGRMLTKPVPTAKPAATEVPVEPAKPEETLSSLRTKIANLNRAVVKQKKLDTLLARARSRGLLTPGLESDADASLYIDYGEEDSYQALNQKLDQAIERLQQRLQINKIAYRKE